ncbi:hypothetical protein GGR58DRAFT_461087 [Xylaria digitata]|nr:hypothetical protein GGR58DRAFT_461087 [Xylaria digitata]
MTPSLEALPIELVEMIVTLLDFQDIGCLRLTSRTVEDKASQMYFTTFFRHKQVILHARRLDDLVRMTASSRLVCCLQHLTIIGPVGLDRAREYRANEHVRLLTLAFRNLKANSPNGSLASLSLRAAAVSTCPDTVPWTEFWVVARRTFKVTMEALEESDLSVTEHLDLFGGATGYSLEYDAFVAFARRRPPINAFGNLKRLSFSLSALLADSPVATSLCTLISLPWNSIGETQSAHAVAVLGAVSRLTGIMPKLESLHLHWRNMGENGAPSVVQPTAVLNRTGFSAPLRLKECSLAGMYVPGVELLKFIKFTRPATLKMRGIHLISGTYAPLLKYLSRPGTPTTSYHLDDICEKAYRFVHFNVPGVPKLQYEGNTGIGIGPNTLSQQTNDAKRKEITYRLGPEIFSHITYCGVLIDMIIEFGTPYPRSPAFPRRIGPHEIKNDVDIGYRYL